MNIVIVTTESDMLGGVFGQAYRESGGTLPQSIFVLEERKDQSYPFWSRGFVAFKLFTLKGIFRLLMARYLRRSLWPNDIKWGLHLDWLQTLSTKTTRILHFNSINAENALNALKDCKPDILISIGAPAIFSHEVLTIPRIGALNVHNGKLPKYRGHFGTFWEVYNKESWAYVCIHKMVERVDLGDLIAFEGFEVKKTSSFFDLILKKKRRGGELLAQVTNKIEKSGRIPDAIKSELFNTNAEYFGWPTLRDIVTFSWQ